MSSPKHNRSPIPKPNPSQFSPYKSPTIHRSPTKSTKTNNQNDFTSYSIHASRIYEENQYRVEVDEIGLFQPEQDVGRLLGKFQDVFQRVLGICGHRWRDLVMECVMRYQELRQVLMHYPQNNHSTSYFHQMHIKSTETKMNLLKMLNQEQRDVQNLYKENQQLKLQIKQAKKLLKKNSDGEMDHINKIKDQQAKIEQLQQQISEYLEKEKKIQNILKQRDKRQKQLRKELGKKIQQLEELSADKQNMRKDLNEIEQKVKNIKVIEPQPERKQTSNQKSSRKICIKIPSKSLIVDEKNDEGDRIEQELYRFLLIQACTIQQLSK